MSNSLLLSSWVAGAVAVWYAPGASDCCDSTIVERIPVANIVYLRRSLSFSVCASECSKTRRFVCHFLLLYLEQEELTE